MTEKIVFYQILSCIPWRFNPRTRPSRIRWDSDRIPSDSDEDRKDPIGIYRIPSNESTNGTQVSESPQDPTVGKTNETEYRNLSDPTKRTLLDMTSGIPYYPKILLR